MHPGGAITVTGRIPPAVGGTSGPVSARTTNVTHDKVTANTALTLPSACGSVPVKSIVNSSPATVTLARMRAPDLPAPTESSTSENDHEPSGRAAIPARTA